MNMKKSIVGVALVLFTVLTGMAADGKAAADKLFGTSEVAASANTEATRSLTVHPEKRLDKLEATVAVMEERLGRTLKKPTATRNFERRMQDAENRLDALERDVKKFDSLERDVKRLEDRLRKVENKQ